MLSRWIIEDHDLWKKLTLLLFLALLFSLTSLTLLRLKTDFGGNDPARLDQPLSLPLSFMPSTAQGTSFQARGLEGTLYFSTDMVAFALPAGDEGQAGTTLRIEFDGANPNVAIEPENPLPGIINSFIGSDPARWLTDVPTYGGLNYRNLYPGVDLHYEGQDGALKGTYTAAPGADVAAVAWHYSGAKTVGLDSETGDLQIGLLNGDTLIEKSPVVWQSIAGQEIPVQARYLLGDDMHLRFDFGSYDPAYPMIIDPTTQYSTYIGGSGVDSAWGVAVDNNGYAYISGRTESADFPATAGALDPSFGGTSDIFVTKINTRESGASSLVWTTYLGGSQDEGEGEVAIDASGNVYVTGGTVSSDDFPVTANAFQPHMDGCCISDGFLSKLNPSGSSLLYSTYLGGSFADTSMGVAADAAGNAYVTGLTNSMDFPVTTSAYNATNAQFHSAAFLSKINTLASGAASLVYSTYFGGASDANFVSRSMALDANGGVYLTGRTYASDFPVTANAFQTARQGDTDAFVAHLDTTQSGTASLVYSTYLGGSGMEDYYEDGAVATNGAGIVYVTGDTTSTHFPTLNAYDASFGGDISDAFLTALDTKASGHNALLYSTYLGGAGIDQAWGLALVGQGVVAVSGQSQSADFPLRYSIHKPSDGYQGAFVSQINTARSGDSSLLNSTFLARQGSGFDGIAVDSSGTAYVAGQTALNDFPVTNGFQSAYGGDTDAFLFVLAYPAQGNPLAAPTLLTPSDSGNVSANGVTLSWNAVPGAVHYNLAFGSSNPPLTTAAVVTGTRYTFPSPLPAVISYWRVQAVDASGQVSDWSDVRSLTLISPPNAMPVLTYFTTTTPTLTWNPVIGAVGYAIEVSDQPNFKVLRYSDDTIPADSLSTTITAPLPSGTYYWRVRSSLGGGKWSAYSAAQSFMVNAP